MPILLVSLKVLILCSTKVSILSSIDPCLYSCPGDLRRTPLYRPSRE